MPEATRTVEIDAPPEVVMATIRDFATYPTFLPEIKEVEVLRMEERGASRAWEVRFTVRYIRRLVYVLRLEQSVASELSWNLVEGVFRHNEGGWQLEPLDDGQRTLARYTIDVQPEVYVPRNIFRSLAEAGLPTTLDRFKKEAERRHRG